MLDILKMIAILLIIVLVFAGIYIVIEAVTDFLDRDSDSGNFFRDIIDSFDMTLKEAWESLTNDSDDDDDSDPGDGNGGSGYPGGGDGIGGGGGGGRH